MNPRDFGLRRLLPLLLAGAALLGGAAGAVLGVCGPFTDVSDAAFCPFVLEIFTLGITTGTTPTTYDPGSSVSRLQMAAFLSRTVDGVLRRGSRRAALDRFWTTQSGSILGVTTVGTQPSRVKSDGADLWVTNGTGATVSRVRASDGRLLETWTGATSARGVLVAMGRVFATGAAVPTKLYQIDPSQTAGAVTTVATNLANNAGGLTFDGARIWVGGSTGVSIVTPEASIPWTVTTVTAGIGAILGLVYDGNNVWATANSNGTVLKLDGGGAVLQTITVGLSASHPAFDGSNIWVPVAGPDTLVVIRASTGAVLATLTGNGLLNPNTAAFDGERILVTDPSADGVSLWKAADLTPLGFFSTGVGTVPIGACSDGVSFWILLTGGPQLLARF